MAKQRTLNSWRQRALTAESELRQYRLPPPKPNDPHIERTCRGKIHWGGFRGDALCTDCLFDLAQGASWIARGGRYELWD